MAYNAGINLSNKILQGFSVNATDYLEYVVKLVFYLVDPKE